MTTTTATDTTPRVWIGCLCCYNDGRLVGDWYPGIEAASVTIEMLHDGGAPTPFCEEMWVMDIEHMPWEKEMSPQAAQRWAELVQEVGEDHADALAAWVRTGVYIADGDDMPTPEDFMERYAGHWDSWDEFVEDLAGQFDLFDKVPEHLHPYIDLQRWGRDVRYDYEVEDAPDGGVFVFHNL